MPPVFQRSARSSPCSNLNSPRCVLQPRPPHKPQEEHLNPHPWSLQLHEDAQVMVPGSAGLRGPGISSCDGNDGDDSLSWMPPKCPFPNPVPEGSCLKPVPNHPGLKGFCFGSGKGITSLFQGGIIPLQHLWSGPCPAGCAHLSPSLEFGDFFTVTSHIIPGMLSRSFPRPFSPWNWGNWAIWGGASTPFLVVPVTRDHKGCKK